MQKYSITPEVEALAALGGQKFSIYGGNKGYLTEMMDNNGKNVCVAVELNKKIQDGGTYLDVNDIRSIHGRDVRVSR